MVSSSRAVLPTNLPVLMSIATRASVWLMTIEPPDLSHTLLRSALLISSVMPNCSKSGVSLV